MAIDEPNDFEALRRRVVMLEAALEAVIGVDLPWSGRDSDYYFDKNFSRRDRRPRLPDDFRYFIDRLYDRREQVFRETFDRIGELGSAQKDISQKLEALHNFTSEQLGQTQRELSLIDARTRLGAAELHQWLANQTLGLIEQEMRTTRFLPMRAYLSDVPQNGLDELTAAIDSFIETFGFEVSDEFPEIIGSWFKKWFVRTKEVASQPEVADRLAKIERALELKGLGAPQAEIDSKQAGAIAALTTSLANVPSAAIQVGSILFLKLTIDGNAVVQARNLSQKELIIIENNQDLLNSPSTIMTKLAKLCPKEVPSTKMNDDAHPTPVLDLPLGIWERMQKGAGTPPLPKEASITPRLPYASGKPPGSSDDEKAT